MADRVLRLASALSLALGPVLVLQGRRVRRTTPRLPGAAGACSGVAPGAEPNHDDAPLDVLVLGESTAAGVGAPEHAQALAGRLALSLAAASSRTVRWRVLGRNGATARTTRTELLASATDLCADVVVLALGVNDVLALRGPAAWTRDLERLITSVRERCGAVPIVVAAVPPLERFPALPQPLRGVLGLRARLLDRAAARLSRELDDVHHVPMPRFDGNIATFFCEDGFHPSPHGYRLWGEALGTQAALAVCAVSTSR